MGEYMNKKISDRVIDEGNYIVNTKKTIRETSYVFGVSKSTVHNDMRYRLSLIDKNLYEKVSSIMEFHADIKHIKGGESTKRKFLKRKV